MKYILLFIAIAFMGCKQVVMYEDLYEDVPTVYNISEPTLELDSIAEIVEYMYDNFYYLSDSSQFGVPDYWQAPQTFIENRGGDCEDYAIFVMYYLEKLGYSDTRLIIYEESENKYHAIIRCKAVYYEPQDMYHIIDQNITPLRSYTLDEALSICYNIFGSRRIEDIIVD